MDLAFGVGSKKSSLYPKSSRVSVLSSRSIIILHFTFRSIIHLGLIVLKEMRKADTFQSAK